MPKKRGNGQGSIYLRGNIWWIAYTVSGQTRYESTQRRSKTEAEAVLRAKLYRHDRGDSDHPVVTLERAGVILGDDYRANGRRSIVHVLRAFGRAAKWFGPETDIKTITTVRVNSYVGDRLESGAAPATVNREMAALKRALRLCHRANLLDRVPHITLLRENNARKGFFEKDDYELVLKYLDEDVRPVVETAYLTGWRIHSEILTREWWHVDLERGWLRLEPGESKTGEGRVFPLVGRLREVIDGQRAKTTVVEEATGQKVHRVFHRSGKPIKTFRRDWEKATTLAGCPDRLLHDFRRTAVRNMERGGVPRIAAMKLVGLRTQAMYERYAITDEKMLREAGEKLAEFLDR